MTAIGFLFIVTAWLIAHLDDHYSVPKAILAFCGLLILTGPVLFVAGVSTWLWRVMP